MTLGIVGHALVAEVNTVLQGSDLFPFLTIIAVIESSGQLLHHYLQIHRGLLHIIHFRYQFLTVVAVDDQLDLSAAFITQGASGISSSTVIAGQSRLFSVLIRVELQLRLCHVGQFLFSAQQRIFRPDLIQLSISGPDPEISGVLGQRPGTVIRVADELPFQIQLCIVKIVEQISLINALRQIRCDLCQAGTFSFVDGKPAVLRPLYGIQSRLSAYGSIVALVRSSAEIITPPLTVLILYQFAVSGSLDGGCGILLTHDRIVGRTFIGP